MRIFLQDAILRPSCHACRAKAGSSGSDLTIADFWGIDTINPSMDDDQGTSLVMVYTSKGAQYLNSLGLDTWEAQYDDVIKFNPSIEISKREHPKRSEFFARLDSIDSVVDLIDKTLRIPLSVRVKRLPRAIAYRLYHILKKYIRGRGNYERSKEQEIINLSGQTEFVIAHPRVSDFTFRSKKNGWKQYRMKLVISDDKTE
jgi:Coenzyme F420 hydrogenase/dehydrogenase, beta subunit C terminus.